MNTKIIVSWILRLLVAIILLQTLYFKFTAHPDSIYIFSTLGIEPWGRIGLGVAELIAALLVLYPPASLFGMILSFGIISGAVFSHLFVLGIVVQDDGGSLFGLAMIVLVASAIYLLLHKSETILFVRKYLPGKR